jgi:ATP-dependent DNA ligase
VRPRWVFLPRLRVRLLSRNDVDHAKRFPELAAAVAGGLRVQTLVLDAEVAIFDDQLRSRFELLRYPRPDVAATPPLLMAFDVCSRSTVSARNTVAPAY